MMDHATRVLEQVFGYREFRPLQAEVIGNILNKNDTLVIMPTGGGKSLCYQIPALIFEGLTIVVSPLLSLMQDQMNQLKELGVSTATLNSTLSFEEYAIHADRIRGKKVKMLFVAPETLLKERTQSILAGMRVDCIAIDEAHCISQWGHDFRPEYRQIACFRKRFPEAVCVALTATATPRVRQDIQESLQFKKGNEFIGSFDRKNLFIEVLEKNKPQQQVLDLIEKYPDQSGIIYCFSRRQVDLLYRALKTRGYSVKPYHAGLGEKERKTNQDLFIRDDVSIMVATIAFGMGINKPNVRFVIHYDLPKNIETYYQEIGRAGRDGLDSHCLLLFNYSDIQKVRFFINDMVESEQRIANVHLNDMLRFVETTICRRIPLLEYFGEVYSQESCDTCDNCKNQQQEAVDITEAARLFLTGVRRSGEIFGTNHIIDILRGSKSQKVLKFNHDEISVYGEGAEYSKKQWFHISRQLIQQGLLVQDLDYGSLKITQKAVETFNNNEPVMGVIEEQKPNPERPKPKESTEIEYDFRLFQQLRKKRKELADEARIPPYVIFPDKTLMEMAAHYPQSEEKLLSLHGVGDVKLKKYAPAFLPLIQEYCDLHQIQ